MVHGFGWEDCIGSLPVNIERLYFSFISEPKSAIARSLLFQVRIVRSRTRHNHESYAVLCIKYSLKM